MTEDLYIIIVDSVLSTFGIAVLLGLIVGFVIYVLAQD